MTSSCAAARPGPPRYGTNAFELRTIARRPSRSRRGTCFAPQGEGPSEEEGTMIWMFAVIAVMGFALVKIRRQRKTRQAAGN